MPQNCPLSPDIEEDTCSTEIDFGDDCQIEFLVNESPHVLSLSGSLRRDAEILTGSSGPDVWDGVWEIQFTADRFKITDPLTAVDETSRAMTYDGKLTRTSDGTAAAAPYQWHHVWEVDPDDDPITLVRGNGDTFTCHGTRDSWVLPGSKVDHFVDTYPTWIPAGEAPRNFHRVVHRTLSRIGQTAALSVEAEITNLDEDLTWEKEGDYTLHRQNPTKVLINGASRITEPDGRTCSIEYIDVLHDLHHRVPIRGKAIVTYSSGLVYTIIFRGVCLVEWKDNRGHHGRLNYCNRRYPQSERN